MFRLLESTGRGEGERERREKRCHLLNKESPKTNPISASLPKASNQRKVSKLEHYKSICTVGNVYLGMYYSRPLALLTFYFPLLCHSHESGPERGSKTKEHGFIYGFGFFSPLSFPRGRVAFLLYLSPGSFLQYCSFMQPVRFMQPGLFVELPDFDSFTCIYFVGPTQYIRSTPQLQ